MTKEELQDALRSVQHALDLTEHMEFRQVESWNALSKARIELATYGQQRGWIVTFRDVDDKTKWYVR